MNSSKKIKIIAIFALLLLLPSASAKVIDFREQYQDYNGIWHTYTNENIASYPFYSWIDTGSNYSISRMDDQLILPKTNTIYMFKPQSISLTLNLTPAQLNSRSVADGINWYIPIPKPLTQLRFGWDNVKPYVTTDIGTNISEDNFWYSKVNGQVRFYYNQNARTIGASSTYLKFEFNSYTINNATTGGWTTANVSLNGSRLTDNGILALNLRNDSQLNMSGLVGYWSMDESQGTIIHNVNTESGFFNTTNQGTWNGNATLNYSVGRIGNAGSFDGVNDYVSVGNDASLNITNAITLESWVKRDVNNVIHAVISKWNYPANKREYALRISATNNVQFLIGTGTSSTQLTSNNTVLAGNWYHIIGVSNNSTMNIYINGVLDIINTPSPTSFSSDSPLNIGIIHDSGSFKGSIDEVRIWNRALSASEIAVLYNTSLRTQAMPVIMNQTAIVSNIINRTRVNYTNQDSNTNISIYARQNGTIAWDLIISNATTNIWYPITNKFNSMDFGVQLNNNGSSTPFFTSLEWDERPDVSSSVSSQSFWDYENASVVFSVNNSNNCYGTLDGITINSCTSPHNFGLKASGSYIYNLNVTNTTSDFWSNKTATITINNNFLSQYNSYTGNSSTSFNNTPVNMIITYQINLNNESNISYVWKKDGVIITGINKSNNIFIDILGFHNISVISTMQTSAGNVSWSAVWDVGVLDGWATVLAAINGLPTIDDVNNAGILGFAGGLFGGMMVIAIIKRYKNRK